MEGNNWTCSYCGHHQTLTSNKYAFDSDRIFVGQNVHGDICYQVRTIGCSNPDCGQIDVQFGLYNQKKDNLGNFRGIDHSMCIVSSRILPESAAKPQPDFIPEPLRVDYLEACRIKELSPKASATLSRRCLQGMIRNYCGIKKGRLIDEITTLRDQVDDGTMASGVTVESVDAIDHVRSIGNIGAHMEKDINLVIDVESEEAQVLIELIELLFDEWYVARKTRQDRLASVQKIAAAKKSAKMASPPSDSEDEEKDSGEAGTEAA